jgi:hypothetical protein
MIRRGLVAVILLLAACERQELPRVTFPQFEQARESVKGGIGQRYEDHSTCRKTAVDAKTMVACMQDRGYGYLPRSAETQATECWRLRDANEVDPLPEALCFVRQEAKPAN